MYICRQCKTEYKDKVEYCECGNNTFDYVSSGNRSLSLEQKSELVSRIFFVICIILSGLIWSIPLKKVTHQQKPKPVVITNIPNIDRIWDSTPLY